MISKSMLAALNGQTQAEFYASYLYLSMAGYAEAKNLKGFSHWLRLQAAEEYEHALRIFNYLLSIGEQPTLEAIEKPPATFGTPKELFTKVLEHEKKVTGMIHKLYEQAVAEKDYRTQNMLQWFVDEQIEEEAQASEILARIEMAEERAGGLLMIDKELGKREKE